ncbi:VWA domain-containing protein [Changchengzhania lutea]|uniref:VWA domain-containing protein n=1 Tax=Changchengzhania lutea TaxID=2049305 RepID=UPI00115E3243|nr:VWA domain-containing protein [Changchengzhania lutea]
MQTETLFYIIIAGIIALFLALFQYWYKSKNKSNLQIAFTVLRFVTYFSMLLLIINPKFEQNTLSIEKPNLAVAIDNSASVEHLGRSHQVSAFLNEIKENKDLQSKFNIEFYTFGEALKASDSTTFIEEQTNISEVFTELSQIYKKTIAPILLISDGNQTYGDDYEYTSLVHNQAIFPVILGDTVNYTDLKIEQLNVNKYGYLKNRFPVEAIVVYNGSKSLNSQFEVKQNGIKIYSETVTFSKSNNSKTINFTLPANRVGVSSYKATIVPIQNEKNKINNSQNFAIEIINEQTKIAVISDLLHPDLGVLKKSIETNEQRSIQSMNPKKALSQINDFQLFILYQPNNSFKKLIQSLDRENKNRFVIAGSKTDLSFLNTVNKIYQFETTSQYEDYQAALNPSYAPFIIDDINFESFPPIVSNYGRVDFSIPFDVILNKTLNGISIDQPLLATFETNGRREAVLFGENVWKWRAQSYLNSKSFNGFDDFFGKLIQYLASNKQRDRLNVDYESFYNGNTNIIIKAQYFDANYVFDGRETIEMVLKDESSKETKTLPFVLKNNSYQLNLNGMAPSSYSFTVRTQNNKMSKSGRFQILDYNVEQKFLNANVTKLHQVATNSQGKSYFIDKIEGLIPELLKDNRFQSIQKNNKNIIPLIDWKYLLILIILNLTLEWFLRKYNGLI